MKTIILTGGGSGGHIMPILAVADEIKRLEPDSKLIYIGQTGDSLGDVPAKHESIDYVYTVRAGKFRRYHGEGFLQHLNPSTLAKNIRDAIYVLVGAWQSRKLLKWLRPDAIFSRGGYISVPVCLAGALLKVPYVTHDSDSTPSLANRLIARWASLHAVALPAETYPYPKNKTVTVGVPVSRRYVPETPELKAQYKKEIKLPQAKEIVLVTGGGNGARQLNDIVLDNAAYLLKRYSGLTLVHVAGRSLAEGVTAKYDKLLSYEVRDRVIVKGFISDLYRYSGAADVVVGRGGANSLAEFAAQAKACVLIPSKQLVWNIKNSQALAEQGAIVQLTEEQAEQEQRFASVISDLLDHPSKRIDLGRELAKIARPQATHDLAVLVLKQAK